MTSMEKINEKALAFFDELDALDEDASFRITNDHEAEWAVEKIAEANEEAARMKAMIADKRRELDAQEERVNNTLDSSTRYLKSLLEGYFRSGVKAKETKTQSSYKLLSATLIMKKPGYKYERDEKALLTWLHDAGREEFIEAVEKPKWAEFKKTLVFDNDTVYDPDTGSIVDGITAVLEPERFEVKL